MANPRNMRLWRNCKFLLGEKFGMFYARFSTGSYQISVTTYIHNIESEIESNHTFLVCEFSSDCPFFLEISWSLVRFKQPETN